MAILAKELLRDMYAARSLTSARWKLVAFYQWAPGTEVPELTRLTKTVSNWETEILNYHVTGISNGPTEAQNLIAEKVRRTGHGMRKFENYRLRLLLRLRHRLLLHSGVQWNTAVSAARGVPSGAQELVDGDAEQVGEFVRRQRSFVEVVIERFELEEGVDGEHRGGSHLWAEGCELWGELALHLVA